MTDVEHVHRYHDGTKHHFHRFAQSLGYLDWASQPHPFRSFHGAPVLSLFPSPGAPPADFEPPRIGYDALFTASPAQQLPVTAASLGYFLRHAFGLSAWKAVGGSRWSLRVNPSSGNLHPTEAYVVARHLEAGIVRQPSGRVTDGARLSAVWHYAADRHALERRCGFDGWSRTAEPPPAAFLVALTSIHWREAWKYGERAFRYCQHDLGHAIASLTLSAALCGWRVAMAPEWPQRDIAALIGIDRDEDYAEAEREEPACVLSIGPAADAASPASRADLLDAVRRGEWTGRASQLSEDHVTWTFIDEVARATEDPGRSSPGERITGAPGMSRALASRPAAAAGRDAAALILQRRSAVALDGTSFVDRSTFLRMLARTLPASTPPWTALWWSPRIHLAVFVHRVEGLAPGLYAFCRADAAVAGLKRAFRPEFEWTRSDDELPLWLLEAGDCRSLARRLSCDQAIAADGFFSLGMIADFNGSLDEHGPAFYRHLYWEAGVVGQLLYLEAEAAGARATGIGCFFDDPVHAVLGIGDHTFQSLYHFTAGIAVEDPRLTTEPGYGWEA